jgi:hypothetical protein
MAFSIRVIASALLLASMPAAASVGRRHVGSRPPRHTLIERS